MGKGSEEGTCLLLRSNLSESIHLPIGERFTSQRCKLLFWWETVPEAKVEVYLVWSENIWKSGFFKKRLKLKIYEKDLAHILKT